MAPGTRRLHGSCAPARPRASALGSPVRQARPGGRRVMTASALLPCLLGPLGGLLAAASASATGQARVEVDVEVALCGVGERSGDGGYTLQGALLEPEPAAAAVRGRLVLVDETDPKLEDADSWIGVVPMDKEQTEGPKCHKEESFATTVVSKMKRALVLGASALLILALNQNTIRELDVSQVLSKPVVVVQTSENVTRLLGTLLRGLRATAKITYQAGLLENVGLTLTLWSTCGLSRGGVYAEWQGVICTGENSSRVQVLLVLGSPCIVSVDLFQWIRQSTGLKKYLQQLWNVILLIALILCTGVIMQAQRQSRQSQSDRDSELDFKQHIAQRLLTLKTRRYHPGKPLCSWAHEIDSCAICLDQFRKNQCLRVLPCLHEFHRDCVDPWLLLQQTCPLCKHNILGNSCRES